MDISESLRRAAERIYQPGKGRTGSHADEQTVQELNCYLYPRKLAHLLSRRMVGEPVGGGATRSRALEQADRTTHPTSVHFNTNLDGSVYSVGLHEAETCFPDFRLKKSVQKQSHVSLGVGHSAT